jgi:hypothetical protein
MPNPFVAAPISAASLARRSQLRRLGYTAFQTALLATTALVGGLWFCGVQQAQAQEPVQGCVVTGAGSPTDLQSGDTLDCNNVTLTETIGGGANGVTITLGDGVGAVDGSADTVLTVEDGTGIVLGGDNGVTTNVVTINSDAAITTSGSNSHGIFAVNGDIRMSGGVISTAGAGSRGMDIGNQGRRISMTGGAITTAGDEAEGIFLDEGDLLMTGGSITTIGDRSHGILIGERQQFRMSGGTITTSGTGAHGIQFVGFRDPVIDGGTISATGEGALAILIVGNTSPTP